MEQKRNSIPLSSFVSGRSRNLHTLHLSPSAKARRLPSGFVDVLSSRIANATILK